MTNKELRDAAVRELKGTTFGYRVRPHSPRWNRAMQLLAQITDAPTPAPAPPPPPPPPPSQAGYAPRAYNTAGGSDARFCLKAEYGVTRDGTGAYVDARGIRYDEGGRDLGGRTKTIVPELKPANEMDSREPCDQYVGPTGRTIGGSAGYPAASFER